jgi:hypothetical protein
LQRLQEEYYGERSETYEKSDYGNRSEPEKVDYGDSHETDEQNESESFSPLNHLKKSIEIVVSNFVDGAHLEVICSVIIGKHIYFCVWGGGKVLVWREGKLATILSGRSGLSGTSSGLWLPGDIFILGTELFFANVGRDILVSSFDKGHGPHDAIDDFAAIAHRQSRPNLSAAFFKINKDEELELSEDLDDALPQDTPQPVVSYDSQEQVSETFSYPEETTTIRLNQLPVWRKWLVKLAEKLPDRDIKINKPSQSSRRTAISVGIVLLVLLGASILFGAQQKKAHDYKASYKDRLQLAETAYNDAVLQKDINPPHSRELFQQARDTVDILLSQGVKDQAVDLLKQKLDQDSGTILGKVLSEPRLFIDLSLVRSGVSAQELAIDKSDLIILDTSGSRIITVGTQNKDTNAVGGAEKLSGARSVTLGDSYYVLADPGIVKQPLRGQAEAVIKQDEEWGDVKKLGFFGSNLYILDKNHGIWRYSATASGFGDKKAWLKEDTTVNFTNAVDMAIDGSVWVITTDGNIFKFNRGVQDNFVVSGIDTFTPTAFYTDENLESIYILDSSNNKIVEVSKTGEYKKQYQAEMIGKGVDLVASKSDKKIYLLTPDKVFTLDLQ